MLHPRLSLDRPLSFFDLETTGKYPDRDRIVDITIITLLPNDERRELSSLINPGIPIPAGASEVHGITDAMVQDAPTFARLATPIRAVLEQSDLAGFNIRRFDVPLLAAEFKRAGVAFSTAGRRLIDLQVIFHKQERRDLSAAVKFYTGATLEGAHRAHADVLASIAVLQGQLDRYPELPGTLDALHQFCRDASWVDEGGKITWQGGAACIAFGKHAGSSLETLTKSAPGRDYLKWIVFSDFPDDTKQIVQGALAGRFPVLPASPEAAHVA